MVNHHSVWFEHKLWFTNDQWWFTNDQMVVYQFGLPTTNTQGTSRNPKFQAIPEAVSTEEAHGVLASRELASARTTLMVSSCQKITGENYQWDPLVIAKNCLENIEYDDISLVVWLPFFIFPKKLGISSSQLTHIFQMGGPTTNQHNLLIWW